METPYCVIDASTLVENIHEIKKWVYNGQIRLVVPLSASERVEQLYQKSIEQKAKPQEPARPKSSGKTARKEHPTFDINPRLTKAFLAWLQRDKENWDPEIPFVVEFQQANEVYTPWKLAEEQGEKRDGSPDKGPTTFAQAVAKANLATQAQGSGEAIRGPMKPKLVARAPGSDSSPWKIGRKVPQVPLREIPAEVRPVLSYVLWRLHERTKGRADASFMIVLSNDPKTQAAGQKLDIEVRKVEEIRAKIASQMTDPDPNSMDDVEREFGIVKPRSKTLQNGSAHDDTEKTAPANAKQISPASNEADLVKDDTVNKIVPEEPNGVLEGKSAKEENGVTENLQNCFDGSTMVDRPITGFLSHEAQDTILSRDLPKQNYPTVIHIAEDNAIQEESGLVNWTEPAQDEFVSEKISNITAWIKNLAPKLSSSPEPSLNSQQGTKPSTKDDAVSKPPVVLQRAAESSTPSPYRSPILAPAVPPPVEDAEDSDEEVVVFNPKAKRLSAQQPLPAPPQSPKPTIAAPVAHSPKSTVNQSPKQNAQRTSRKATASRQHQAKAPHVVPAIIDPDAFGRSFTTNPRSNNHPNSRYSPRGSPGRADIRTSEPELDYVLKSGNTRASVRGKGKLWVP